MPKSRKISAAAILIASCLFVIASLGIALLQAQTTQHSKTLEEAAVASRKTSSLSADILLTWRAGGVSRESHGTIQLQRPNLARIVLQGDYPEVLLVSDGHTRYFAPSETKYQPYRSNSNRFDLKASAYHRKSTKLPSQSRNLG